MYKRQVRYLSRRLLPRFEPPDQLYGRAYVATCEIPALPAGLDVYKRQVFERGQVNLRGFFRSMSHSRTDDRQRNVMVPGCGRPRMPRGIGGERDFEPQQTGQLFQPTIIIVKGRTVCWGSKSRSPPIPRGIRGRPQPGTITFRCRSSVREWDMLRKKPRRFTWPRCV